MTFLRFKQKNLVIVDFQLIYDTDSFIQLDFYAEGLRREPFLYNQPPFLERVSYGFVKGTYEDYDRYEKKFHKLLSDPKWVNKNSINMIQSVRELQKMNIKIEKSIKQNFINVDLWRDYFNTIAKMLSFKRFSDLCDPIRFSNEKKKAEDEIKEITTPSHILLFYREINRLRQNPSHENICHFIEKYGFLYDFNIKETPFENTKAIREYLFKKEDSPQEIIEVKKRKIPETFSGKLYKRIVFYEEWRHYHQARAIRNCRNILKYLNMNIYKTGVDDLLKEMKKNEGRKIC